MEKEKVWFSDSIEINCSLEQIKQEISDLGSFYASAISRMPGLSKVALLDQTDHSITIKTNEGLMERTSIKKRIDPGSILIDFDETYTAGKLVQADVHFKEEFTPLDKKVKLHLTLSDLRAPGILGFFYRHLASKNIGRALLSSSKKHLEAVSSNFKSEKS